MDTTYWSEIEAGMALAGLQLQANALGLKWEIGYVKNPENEMYRSLFELDAAEDSINLMAKRLENQAKNEHMSLKGKLIPILFFLPL